MYYAYINPKLKGEQSILKTMTISQSSPPKCLQKDNLSEEYKKLLSIPPKEKEWIE